MPKPIISIDIDDVLADTTERLRIWANEQSNCGLSRDHYMIDSEYWGFYEEVWRQAGIEHLIDFSQFEDAMRRDQSSIAMITRAKETLHRFSDKYRYVLITSRDESQKEATIRWIEARFGPIFEGLYFTGNRHSDGYKNKGELCANLGASLHIDDNPQHCKSTVSHGVGAILFGYYGWNQSSQPHLTRCHDWSEVGEYLERTKF